MRLAGYDGERVLMEIDSTVLPSTGVQLIGRWPGTDPDAGTVVVSAHVDSTPDTPGAIDDAAGVAVLLAVADLLCDRGVAPTLEFVPFNGEDHTLAPGELAYLAARRDLSDIETQLRALGVDVTADAGERT